MATTGRWFEAPMHNRRIAHRLTLAERIQRWYHLKQRQRIQPDLYMVTGFNPPIYPRR